MKLTATKLALAVLAHPGIFTSDLTAARARTLYGDREQDMPSPQKTNIEDETLEQFRARQAALKKK